MYPPISDYALIGDCHSAALISRAGSIDWCCLPRFDSDSCFGRLLDWNRGGHFTIAPRGSFEVERAYVPDSLILVTTYRTRTGIARVTEFFAMRRGGRVHPRREIVRIVQGVQGRMRFDVAVSPRFDFGEVKPWIYPLNGTAHAAVGSNTGLVIFGDVPLRLQGKHDLCGSFVIRAGERRHLAVHFAPPEELPDTSTKAHDAHTLEWHYDETLRWWHEWTRRTGHREPPAGGVNVIRSAIVLKALTYAPTGAIIAAPTTSLPEHVGGERNWDYRYSWIRDSVLTVDALAALGCVAEADGFRRFVQRSAAGNADELQVMYAVDGKRRIPEIVLDRLEGWRGSRPVRIGNAASHQFQSDMYGLILELSWRWSALGNSPGQHYWNFLVELVEAAIAKWPEPDYGIWEVRSEPRHFVHSKVMCWAAVDRGIELARAHSLKAPLARWRRVRAEIRAAIEAHGIDRQRGIFVGYFGGSEVDAALLLLPGVRFVAHRDPIMMRTAEAIRRDLDAGGLILRYRTDDGLRGPEGTFVACSFWLAECLARQGRLAEARAVFDRACGCANDLGLFSEEFDVSSGQMLGNFPQGLTHLAHIAAALALEEAEGTLTGRAAPASSVARPSRRSRAARAPRNRSSVRSRRTTRSRRRMPRA